MWFKRRKKTEQDQALSQSLRSLQSLLNDSDRREPSLAGHRPESNPEASDETGEPGRRPAAPSLNTDERTQPPVFKEPSPPDSASRWRDLSLSFDAEPVATPARSRQDREDDEVPPEVEPDDELPENEPERGSAGRAEEHEPPEQAMDDTPADEELDTLEESTGEEDVDEMPAVEPPVPGDNVEPVPPAYDHEDDDGEDTGVRENNDTGYRADGDIVELDPDSAASGDNDTEPEPVLVTDDTLVDFEAFSRPPGGPPADNGSVESLAPEGGADEAVAADDDTPELEWEAPAPPADVQEHVARGEKTDAGEPAEDQLYLELEPVDNDSEDAIPTLTEAVYVPDTSPVEPETELTAEDTADAAPPEVEQPLEDVESPVDPADDEPAVLRTIERLRVRLQLMGLDALSSEQEAQLRETLEEFMDEMRDDASGH